MQFRKRSRMDPRNHACWMAGVHICATCRIQLNDLYAARWGLASNQFDRFNCWRWPLLEVGLSNSTASVRPSVCPFDCLAVDIDRYLPPASVWGAGSVMLWSEGRARWTPTCFCFTTRRSASAVYAAVMSACPPVCLSQAAIVSKRLDESNLSFTVFWRQFEFFQK